MDIYTYIKNRISERAADIIGSQIDLDDHTERTWFNLSTNVLLSNDDYFRTITNKAINDTKTTLKNDIEIANKIINYYFTSKEDFKYIDVIFEDNYDDSYTVRIVTNFDGYRECVLGLIDWDDVQGVYVLWTGASYSDSDSGLQDSSDEGVSYSDNLQETEDDIKDELIDEFIYEHTMN